MIVILGFPPDTVDISNKKSNKMMVKKKHTSPAICYFQLNHYNISSFVMRFFLNFVLFCFPTVITLGDAARFPPPSRPPRLAEYLQFKTTSENADCHYT